jgi:SecD/SecF fusion protein
MTPPFPVVAVLFLFVVVVFAVLASVAVGLAWLLGTWWKVAIVLLVTGAGVVPVLVAWPPRLGLDLRGGVVLVYEALPEDRGAGGDSEPLSRQQMDKLIAAVRRRVNPRGSKQILVRRHGARQIEVILPEVDEAELARTKRLMSACGTLEFRVLANRRDHATLIEQAEQIEGRHLRDSDGKLLAWWVPVAKGEEEKLIDYSKRAETVYRKRTRNGYEWTEFLVVNDVFNVNGSYLVRAAPSIDASGRPCVVFTFNHRGGLLFGGLTESNLPQTGGDFYRHLGIILDGYLQSAPQIRSAIYERGEITGDFTRQEVEDIVDILNAGSLPAALSEKPLSESLIGPTVGVDVLARWTLVLGAVLLFSHLLLVLRYRLAGLAAVVACLWNLLLIPSAIVLDRASWTFSGLMALFFVLFAATACNLLVCVLVRGRRRHGDDPLTAVRKGWRRALVPVLAVLALLYAIGEAVFVFADPLSRVAAFGYSDSARSVGLVVFFGSLSLLFTSVFVLQAFLEVAAKLVQNAGPAAMRLLFPTPAPAAGENAGENGGSEN